MIYHDQTRMVGPTSISIIDAPGWALCCLTLHACPPAACSVHVMASRWQQQPPLASLHRLTEGQVEQSAASAGSVLSVAFIFNDVCAKIWTTCCAPLSTESNLSRCGFRGSSHIGIPYSTKVPLLKPRALKCGRLSGTERWIFVFFFVFFFCQREILASRCCKQLRLFFFYSLGYKNPSENKPVLWNPISHVPICSLPSGGLGWSMF